MGIVFGISIARKEAERIGEDPEKIMDLCFYLIVSAIFGSRLSYVPTNPGLFFRDPLEILRIWNGGLNFYGGFIAALIIGLIYMKSVKMPVLKTADIMAPSVAIGEFLGRLGCFFSGSCYGRTCDLPWAVTYTHPDSLAPIGIPLHPTQLYSSFNNLMIFGILLFIRRYKKFDGQVFWVYLLLYSITRSFIEIFRGDYRVPYIFKVLSVSQAAGAVMAAVAVVMIMQLRRPPEKD